MKIITFLGLFLIFFISSTELVQAKLTIGQSEKMIMIYDLPQKDEYLSDKDQYFDLGYKYTVFEFCGLPLFQTENGMVVGYSNSNSFVYLDASEINQIIKSNNITDIDSLTKIPFWDAWGGRLVVLAIIIVAVGYSLKEKIDKKREKQKASA